MTASTDPADEEHVRRMLSHLVHRGPDDEGLTRSGRALLGVRRLSVIDLAGGHQPVAGEGGRVIAVQNGEIYNFRELRAELVSTGHVFRSAGDTEVIPHAYEEWGLDFLTRLRGMFALAVWDTERELLLLARDRIGKKPLFYAQLDDRVLFASELQALMSCDVPRDIDERAIEDYLAFGYVPAPRTAFARVRKVLPGHVLIFAGEDVETRRYWHVRWEPKARLSFDEAAERFRVEFREAVRLRLVSDVPLGVLLSGGLDSSSVVAMAAPLMPTRLRTFSVGFTEADYDELRYARIVAQAFDTEHHEFVVRADAADVLPRLVRHFGEPFADSSAIPTFWVAHEARAHVTVALNGDGGDELFGGYLRYQGVALASMLDRLPGAAQGLSRVGGLLPAWLTNHRQLGRALRFMRAATDPPDVRYLRWVGYFTGPRRRALRLDGAGEERLIRQLSAAADDAGALDPVERAMAADLATYMPGDLLPKMDIAAMANSLETRSPFLDHHVVELVAAMPRHFKVSARRTKILLRHAMRGILPDAILERGKMGFGVPVGSWLRASLRESLSDLLLSPNADVARYVDHNEVRRLVEDHLEGRADNTPYLWCLLMLEYWFRECVRGAPPPPVAAGTRLGQTTD